MGFLEQLFSRPDAVDPVDSGVAPEVAQGMDFPKNGSASAPPTPREESGGQRLEKPAEYGPVVHFRKYAGAPFIATLRPVTLAATVAPEAPSAAHAPAAAATPIRPVAAQPPHVRPVVVRPADHTKSSGNVLRTEVSEQEISNPGDAASRIVEWPGVRACAIWAETTQARAGQFAVGFEPEEYHAKIRAFSVHAAHFSAASGVSATNTLMICAEEQCIAISTSGNVVVYVLADGGDLEPGIRERLAKVALRLGTTVQ